MPASIAARLAGGLTDSALITDPDVMTAYRRDQTPLLPAGLPAAVCLPATTEEIAFVLRTAHEIGVPVVTRGAGSGLAGGANAVDGCVVLVTTRLDRILAIEPADQYAVVQPGVLNAQLKTAAAEVGLRYPPDPASYEFSTLGGNIATNAGGLCCVKYGVTRDYVLGLEVVLADGTVLRTGRRTVKGVAGYDLTALFVGSEGTLGVITEATLRLQPATASPATLAAFFPTLESAGAAVVDICSGGPVPSLLELMDRTTVAAVDARHRMELDRDAAALLLAQSDAPGNGSREDVQRMSAACERHGATFVVVTDDEEEGRQLLAARRLAYSALEDLGTTLLDDVAVPRSRIPELLRGIDELTATNGATVATFGHAGDGNFHPTVVYDAADALESQRALDTFDAIVRLALSLGGTVTGEHGVGLLKRTHLALELDAGAQQAHAAIKAALDPRGILNPGKVL